MESDILTLSRSLISIPSIKENPSGLDHVLTTALEPLANFPLTRFNIKDCPSVLVSNCQSEDKHYKIILNAHLDVVPALPQQFQPYIKDSKLFGRGAYDMKAAAAACILVFREVASQIPFPLAIQLVTDEETGGFNGTKYQVDQGVTTDFVLAGEPTDFGINHLAKGVLWLTIKSRGVSSHGAYPWQGRNAVWNLYPFLPKLLKAFTPPTKEVWKTTVNLSQITTSNVTFNKVPDFCELKLDIRYIPKDKDLILQKITSLLPPSVEYEVVLQEPAQVTDAHSPFIKELKKTIRQETGVTPKLIVKHGGSDIRHFTQNGASGVTFGPLGFGLHTDNEWVDLASLSSFFRVIRSFLLNLV